MSFKVQRIVVIMLLSCQLVTNTELCELLKIPVLVSHYEEHKGNTGLTFIGFLRMHYFNGAPHDNTDMDLPFKTNSAALVISQSLSISLPAQPFASFIPFAPVQGQAITFYTFYLPTRSQHAIFQPPRVA